LMHYGSGDKWVYFTKAALDEITQCLGTQYPEQGGFLFGYENTVVKFVWDRDGGTTGVSYNPSKNSTAIINQTEKDLKRSNSLAVFCGVVHSHPSTMCYPSGPDCDAMDSLLSLNLNLAFVIAPIVTFTHGYRVNTMPHDIILSNYCKMSCFYKERNRPVLRFSFAGCNESRDQRALLPNYHQPTNRTNPGNGIASHIPTSFSWDKSAPNFFPNMTTISAPMAIIQAPLRDELAPLRDHTHNEVSVHIEAKNEQPKPFPKLEVNCAPVHLNERSTPTFEWNPPEGSYDDVVIALHEFRSFPWVIKKNIQFDPIFRIEGTSYYYVKVSNWPDCEFIIAFPFDFPTAAPRIIFSTSDTMYIVPWRQETSYPDRIHTCIQTVLELKKNELRKYSNQVHSSKPIKALGVKEKRISIIGNSGFLATVAIQFAHRGWTRLDLVDPGPSRRIESFSSTSSPVTTNNIKLSIEQKIPNTSITCTNCNLLEEKSTLKKKLNRAALVIICSNSKVRAEACKLALSLAKPVVLAEPGIPCILPRGNGQVNLPPRAESNTQEEFLKHIDLELLFARVSEILEAY